jgi:hypothetical protein
VAPKLGDAFADAELLDDITALPARLQRAIRKQQADAEILIAWILLAIVLLFSLSFMPRRRKPFRK